MSVRMEYSVRGIERATANTGSGEHRLVPTTVNGRTEMLPSDPRETAKILRERRTKQSPAARAKARMAAAMRKRGLS